MEEINGFEDDSASVTLINIQKQCVLIRLKSDIYVFPVGPPDFYCNCSKKRVSLGAKTICHPQTVDATAAEGFSLLSGSNHRAGFHSRVTPNYPL